MRGYRRDDSEVPELSPNVEITDVAQQPIILFRRKVPRLEPTKRCYGEPDAMCPSALEWRVLKEIDGRRSIGEIESALLREGRGSFSEDDVDQALHAFWSSQVIRYMPSICGSRNDR